MLVLVAAMVMLVMEPSSASPVQILAPKMISGASPLLATCTGAGPFAASVRDSEVRPEMAVNPADPRNIVVVWKQDPNTTIVVGRTADGGESWEKVLVPVGHCTGAVSPYPGSNDPDLAFGPDGRLYMVSEAWDASFAHTGASVIVNVSADRGETWSQPQVLAPGSALGAVAADPVRPGTAYVVAAAPLGFNFLTFSRTLDGGATWSPPTPFFVSDRAGLSPDHLFAWPDGSLLAVFEETVNPTDRPAIWSIRSADRGQSWSAPVRIGEFSADRHEVRDPSSGEQMTQCCLLDTAVGSDGNAFVVWPEVFSTSSSRIVMARSGDHGATWSAPTPIHAASAQMFMTSVAVHEDGTVALSYYDTRSNVPDDAELTTDVWFRHSHDRGATWTEEHLGGPFDLLSVRGPTFQHPALGGGIPWIGYQQGLEAAPEGFVTAFTMGAPRAEVGASDIFFSRIRTVSDAGGDS